MTARLVNLSIDQNVYGLLKLQLHHFTQICYQFHIFFFPKQLVQNHGMILF